MKDGTDRRKVEHIDIIRSDAETDRRKFYFDNIRLTHRALPEADLGAIDPSTTFMGKTLSFPLLISSMTGGDHDMLSRVNHNLARAAEATGVAMGVGSQRVMFGNEGARKSFALRDLAPTTLLFANLGAVQLNYGFGLSHCQEAVSVVGADALYFHLNPLQEAVQPEGNTNFAGLTEKIGAIADELSCPVVVKEVGAGIAAGDAARLYERGIRYVDVAGSGGTSWSRIEHHRQPAERPNDLGLVFQDWGIPTPLALQRLYGVHDELTLIASGGIRSGVDMAKAMVLGASLCGMASPFLEPALTSAEAVIIVIEALKREFTTAMFLCGATSVSELHANDALILK